MGNDVNSVKAEGPVARQVRARRGTAGDPKTPDEFFAAITKLSILVVDIFPYSPVRGKLIGELLAAANTVEDLNVSSYRMDFVSSGISGDPEEVIYLGNELPYVMREIDEDELPLSGTIIPNRPIVGGLTVVDENGEHKVVQPELADDYVSRETSNDKLFDELGDEIDNAREQGEPF